MRDCRSGFGSCQSSSSSMPRGPDEQYAKLIRAFHVQYHQGWQYDPVDFLTQSNTAGEQEQLAGRPSSLPMAYS